MAEYDFEIVGLGGGIITMLIVEAIKRIFVNDQGKSLIADRWAVLLSIVVGIVLSCAAYLASQDPRADNIVAMLVRGLIAGLTACGIFSGTKKRGAAQA